MGQNARQTLWFSTHCTVPSVVCPTGAGPVAHAALSLMRLINRRICKINLKKKLGGRGYSLLHNIRMIIHSRRPELVLQSAKETCKKDGLLLTTCINSILKFCLGGHLHMVIVTDCKILVVKT